MPHPLQKIAPLAQAVSELFGAHVEVIIHDILEDRIFAIFNNISGQEVGMPSELGLENDSDVFEQDVLGPYEKIGTKGQRINSISAVVRDDDDKAIGLLCVNADYSSFSGAIHLLEQLISPPRVERKPAVLFRNDWQELILEEVTTFLKQRDIAQHRLKPDQRRELIKEIDAKGLLYARRSVDQLSSILSVSRSTLYKDLARVRENDPLGQIVS